MHETNDDLEPTDTETSEDTSGKVHAEEFSIPGQLASLSAAQHETDGVVIVEGGYGSEIMAVALARRVTCDQATLEDLVDFLDRLVWSCGEGPTAGLVFRTLPIGATVSGGIGNVAVVSEDVWIHPRFHEMGLAQHIRDVIEHCSGRMSEMFEPIRAVIRIDKATKSTDWEDRVHVVMAFATAAEARAEANRWMGETSRSRHYFFTSRGLPLRRPQAK